MKQFNIIATCNNCEINISELDLETKSAKVYHFQYGEYEKYHYLCEKCDKEEEQFDLSGNKN